MKVVCMGTYIGDELRKCGKHLKGDPNDTEVSHGVCADCKAAYQEAAELRKLATAAMDAEDLFDLDELERHADMLRAQGGAKG